MQTVCFFNNKGGVGKTTLATNIASFLATNLGKRVLVLDLDPQCNTTQLILESDLLEAVMHDSSGQTVMKAIEPLQMGDASVSNSYQVLEPDSNSFKVAILPGHPSLSLFEDQLSKDWLELQGGTPAGLRRSLWLAQLFEQVRGRYDIAIVDMGPSFGALNRSILLGCDYFVSPLGCDFFSLIGVRNIGKWLRDCGEALKGGLDTIYKRYPQDALARYRLDDKDIAFAEFLGYTVMQYITKSKGGERRPTQAFEKFRVQIPDTISDSLGGYTPSPIHPTLLELGDVPNMYSIVPLAQYSQKPVHLLDGRDGLAGAAFAQHKTYVQFIKGLSENLVRNLEKSQEGGS
ncbi:MAG: AAA family ATPase [Nitrospirae bacterium]|nr:AAA family ATPase [Fimbriimonadaceae bacterium]